MLNQHFGSLTVIREGAPARRRAWICRCDCGTITTTLQQNLLNGHSRSCGCGIGRANHLRATHGESHTERSAEYDAWRAMKNRCYTASNNRFHRYGGRGIYVCDKWRDSFQEFLADMGRRPSPEHSLDRIDVNGHYEPSNVQWATPEQQSNNRHDCRYVTHLGETLTVYQWARRIGIHSATIRGRLRDGWPVPRALTEPVHRQSPSIRYDEAHLTGLLTP